MLLWWLAVGCGALGSNDGELWLTLHGDAGDGNRVMFTIPASALREPGEPAILETAQGAVDLRPVAGALKPGRERQWTLHNGEQVTLKHAEPLVGQTTQLAFGLAGPKGNGLMMTVPLQPDQIERAHHGVELNLRSAIPIGYDASSCAQLRRSPPMSLVEIVGPKGNGLRVETR